MADTELADTTEQAARDEALRTELALLRREVDELRRENQELAALARFPRENPNPVLRLAADGTVLYANRASAPLLATWGCRVGEQAPEAWRRIVKATLEGGRVSMHDAGYDGRIVSFVLVPAAGEGFCDLYGRDVTEQWRTDEALRRREETFRTLFEVLPIGLSTLDEQGRVLAANEALPAILQLPRERIVAGDYAARTYLRADGTPLPAEEFPTARVFREKRPVQNVEIGIVKEDGETIWTRVSAAPVPLPNVAVVVATADITAFRHAQSQLEQANTRLQVQTEELEMQAEELQAQNSELALLSAELETQRARLEAIVQQMPAGVLIAEAPSGRIALMNRQAEGILRGPYRRVEEPDEYMQYESFYPDGRRYLPEEMPLARTMVSGEQVLDEEIHFVRGDGSRGVLVCSSSPVLDRQGRIAAGVLVFYDVTERQAMEEALRQAEERYRAFVEHSSEGIWRIELEQPIPTGLPLKAQVQRLYRYGYLAECNRALARMHGFASAEEAEGTRLGQLMPRLSPNNAEYLQSFVRSGYRLVDVESTELDREGGIRYFSNSLIGIVDAERGLLLRLWAVKRDSTERRQIEIELRRARDELATLLAIAQQVGARLDLQPLLDEAADLLKEVVDFTSLAVYRFAEHDQVTVTAYRQPPLPANAGRQPLSPAQTDAIARALAQGRPLIVSDLAADSEATRTWREPVWPGAEQAANGDRSWLLVPLLAKSRLIGVLHLAHEEPGRFTEREAELALAFANQVAIGLENARLYEEAKEAAASRERQRLARELHDAVSQTLFSASITTDVLPTLYERDPNKGRELLAELRDLQRGAMAEMRALLLELRPAALLEADLGTLLRHLSQAITGRARIPIALDVRADCKLPPELQIGFYRIAQEALNNVVKHSGASGITVSLDCVHGPKADGTAESVKLVITDDGCGFDLKRVPPDRLGLGIMAERARELGASLQVESAAGQGTRVTVTWRVT